MSNEGEGYKAPRPTYTKWFWKDLRAKTQGMSTTGIGAYVLILGYMVTVSPDYCSAPDDDSVLSRVSGLGLKAWRRVRPEVVAQLELTDAGRLRSRRLYEDALLWSETCYLQHLRRTGGPPTVDRGSTGARPDDDHARSREIPEARKNLGIDSVPLTERGAENGNPTPVGVQGPVAIAPGRMKPAPADETWSGWRKP